MNRANQIKGRNNLKFPRHRQTSWCTYLACNAITITAPRVGTIRYDTSMDGNIATSGAYNGRV